MTHKINIQYFKQSGKWYTSATLDMLPEEYFFVEGIAHANMNAIGDRVIELTKSHKLPGLVG